MKFSEIIEILACINLLVSHVVLWVIGYKCFKALRSGLLFKIETKDILALKEHFAEFLGQAIIAGVVISGTLGFVNLIAYAHTLIAHSTFNVITPGYVSNWIASGAPLVVCVKAIPYAFYAIPSVLMEKSASVGIGRS